MAGFWDSEEIVAEVPKNHFEKYVISACRKGARAYVNVREWYEKDGQFFPGKAGVALPLSVVSEIIEGLTTAAESLQDKIAA